MGSTTTKIQRDDDNFNNHPPKHASQIHDSFGNSSSGTMLSSNGSTMEIKSPSKPDLFKVYMSNKYLVSELVFCILIGILGEFGPAFIFQISLHERNIPYQMTANGDVILDSSFNQPLVDKETIPDWTLALLSFLFPLLIIITSGVRSNIKLDLHSGICTFFFAMGSNIFITEFTKLYCGYLRPNFYSYCAYSEETMECESESSDPRKSFPSGHASSSFCSMSLLTLLFYGKIGLHRKLASVENQFGRTTEYYGSNYFKKRIMSVLSAFPLFLAAFIAASRVHDNMHHPADVIAGSVIGICCSLFAYGLWYHSIYSPFAGQPLQTSFEMNLL